MGVIFFVLGLCCGSFVNMLVYRTAVDYGLLKLGRDKSRPYTNNSRGLIHQTRSYCDYCGKQLDWYENIPVVSWIVQRGKTRCCRKKLSILYPITEIITGLLFLIHDSRFMIQESNVTLWVLGLLIIVFLVFSAVFDVKYMILPDFSTVILVISALVFWGFGHLGEWNYLVSAAAAFGFLGLLYLITKGRGMGLGDVKLAIFMGLFLGWQKTILAFYIAFVGGALIALVLMVFKKAGRKTLVPFGPFLIFGTLVAWFWGDQLFSLSAFQFFR